MRNILLLILFIFLLPFIGGCPGSAPSEFGYINIPLFKNPRLIENDSMGALVGIGYFIGNLRSFTTYIWDFKVNASRQELLDFYQSKYSNARLDGENTELTAMWIETEDPKVNELTIDIYEGESSILKTTYD